MKQKKQGRFKIGKDVASLGPFWIIFNVQSDSLRCNFQVVEVLATVIKKEKEDKTENKGGSRYRQLC